MGITNFSALSIESGVSCGALDAAATTASTMSLTSGLSADLITTSGVSLTGIGTVSLITVATEASVVTHSLALLHQASGITLCWRSGDTLYLFAAVSNISVAI